MWWSHTQWKISCKILDTLQEKGHFMCKILAPCKFLTRFLLLAKNCARNMKFLAQFLQVSCKKGDIFSAHSVHVQCTERARTCKIFFPGQFQLWDGREQNELNSELGSSYSQHSYVVDSALIYAIIFVASMYSLTV